MDASDFDRVLHECARWGVGVVHAAPASPHPHSRNGDIAAWLAWPARIIFMPHPHPLALLHELGHAVIGVDPATLRDEVGTGILAFEIYEQRRLGMGEHTPGWFEWMRTNGMWNPPQGVVPYFQASESAIAAELQLSLADAVRLGVLHQDGRPTYQLAPLRCRERGCERAPDATSGWCARHDGSLFRRRRT